MDRPVRRWDWLPAAMPRVAALMKSRRLRDGDDWVNECWRRGVIDREPGWFYAYEAGIAVGVPSAALLADPLVTTCRNQYQGLAMLFTREKGAADGAH